jgi:ring-1,2-phenylacetyl-CoA epoxidase subunit PaaC
LVEQANGNFGTTMTRQFFYDAFNLLQYELLCDHQDENLKAIATKTIKEIKYHYRYSSEWMIRLGAGTEQSHAYVQEAVNELWRYTGELFKPASYETDLLTSGWAIDVNALQAPWMDKVKAVFEQAGLIMPDSTAFLYGGKEGRHTEQLGYILTELQYMQRTYPQMKW